MVRLSFHDCVGGCDGCVNIENDSNNGLADLIAALDLVYDENDFKDILSRADHWAIMGIWAVQTTIDNAVSNGYTVPDLNVEYTYGRTVGFSNTIILGSSCWKQLFIKGLFIITLHY